MTTATVGAHHLARLADQAHERLYDHQTMLFEGT